MVRVTFTDAWKAAYPDGLIGLLEVAGVDNRAPAEALEAAKREVERRLRERYGALGRPQIVAAPVMRDYVRYYKRFDKTYHVLQQVESVALKGRDLPKVSPLVDANFAAELDTLVLTAGHDAAKVLAPVQIDVARAGDRMKQMSGAAKDLPDGDMVMRDAGGVACSILYGQDTRSPISPATTAALYVAYGPPGVPDADVRRQLEGILAYVKSFSPACVVEQLGIVRAAPC